VRLPGDPAGRAAPLLPAPHERALGSHRTFGPLTGMGREGAPVIKVWSLEAPIPAKWWGLLWASLMARLGKTHTL